MTHPNTPAQGHLRPVFMMWLELMPRLSEGVRYCCHRDSAWRGTGLGVGQAGEITRLTVAVWIGEPQRKVRVQHPGDGRSRSDV